VLTTQRHQFTRHEKCLETVSKQDTDFTLNITTVNVAHFSKICHDFFHFLTTIFHFLTPTFDQPYLHFITSPGKIIFGVLELGLPSFSFETCRF